MNPGLESAASPHPSEDPSLVKARELLEPCRRSDVAGERARYANEIAALWRRVEPESKAEVGLIYAQALRAVAALTEEHDDALDLASRIGGLLALPGLRSRAIASEYAQALYYAATVSESAWERAQRAAQIEDLLDDGEPFDEPEIALCFARALYVTTLLERDESKMVQGLARLERIVRGKHTLGVAIVSPELHYELAKLILLVAVQCDVQLVESRRDEVRQLVGAENATPGDELDDWLTQFASVGHGLDDFAIELLGIYRTVRELATRREF